MSERLPGPETGHQRLKSFCEKWRSNEMLRNDIRITGQEIAAIAREEKIPLAEALRYIFESNTLTDRDRWNMAEQSFQSSTGSGRTGEILFFLVKILAKDINDVVELRRICKRFSAAWPTNPDWMFIGAYRAVEAFLGLAPGILEE